MKNIKHISIIGAGAMGSLYADMLAQVPNCFISLIADGERYERLKNNTITVNGKKLSASVTKPNESEVADLVIVAVKHQDLDNAVQQISPFISKETLIISLLNGLESEEQLSAKYGKENVLLTIAIGMDAARSDNAVICKNQGKLIFGEADNTIISPNVSRLQNLFEKAKINYETPTDMLKTIWWKFMVNVGMNQASAVCGASHKLFQSSNELKQLMEDLMREVIMISKYENINLTEQDLDNWYKILKTLSPIGKTSMLQDIEAGRKTEVDIFAGKVIELAQKHGLNVPVNKSMLQIIKILEKK